MSRNMKRWIALLMSGLLAIALCARLYYADANPQIILLSRTLPAPNAFDDFNAANLLIRDEPIYSPRLEPPIVNMTPSGQPGSLGGITATQRAKVMSDNAAAVDRIRAGLRHGYECPLSRTFTIYPDGLHFDHLARLLKFEGRVAALRSDWPTAARDDTDALQIGQDCPRGGLLEDLEVEQWCSAIGRRDLWTAADHLDARTAEQTALRIEQMQQQRVPFAETLDDEKWSREEFLTRMFQNKEGVSKFLSFDPASPPSSSDDAISEQLIYMVYPKRDMLSDCNRYMDALIAKARKPYFAASKLPDPELPSDPVSRLLLAPIDANRFRDVSDDASTQLIMTVLALRSYKLDHNGSYPQSLSSLVPKYLAAVPYDPFAEKDAPLHYRRAGTSYVLYSVGADGIDDGGKPFINRTPRTPTTRWENPDTKGDIVTGINED